MLHLLAVEIPKLPTASDVASYNQLQFLQVLLWFAMLALGAIAIFFIRKSGETSREMIDLYGKQFDKQDERYVKQDARYERQETRHQERDEKTITALQNGLAGVADSIERLVARFTNGNGGSGGNGNSGNSGSKG